jgi:hypothetical protein
MCVTGGRCVLGIPSPVREEFRLVAVQAVTHNARRIDGYEDRVQRISDNRKAGLPYFNFPVREQLGKDQLHVLDVLRSQFHEKPPGTDPRDAHTFYSFHGCRPEHVQNICKNGIVATQATDAGYFDSGCYSTLNVEYAVRYYYTASNHATITSNSSSNHHYLPNTASHRIPPGDNPQSPNGYTNTSNKTRTKIHNQHLRQCGYPQDIKQRRETRETSENQDQASLNIV